MFRREGGFRGVAFREENCGAVCRNSHNSGMQVSEKSRWCLEFRMRSVRRDLPPHLEVRVGGEIFSSGNSL